MRTGRHFFESPEVLVRSFYFSPHFARFISTSPQKHILFVGLPITEQLYGDEATLLNAVERLRNLCIPSRVTVPYHL